jgi:hypothetical protein
MHSKKESSCGHRFGVLAALLLSSGACHPTLSERFDDDVVDDDMVDDEQTDTSATVGGDDGASSETSSTDSGGTTHSNETDCVVVYVNFDGAVLTAGTRDDARANITQVPNLGIELAPYDGNAMSEILARLELLFEDFDVCITSERPEDGDYTMAIVTPTDPFGGVIHGVASEIDCGNQNPNNIVFGFFGANDLGSVFAAGSLAKSLGHSFGLEEHVQDEEDLMHQSGFGTTALAFKDTCIELPFDEPSCRHDTCGVANQQSSWQRLRDVLGTAR